MSDNVGFPQLDFHTYPSQIFWLVITFAIMYLMMSKVVIPPIRDLVDARNAKRKSDLDKAEKLSNETHKIMKDYETALEGARVMAAQTLLSTERNIKIDTDVSRETFTLRLENELNEAETTINKVKEQALESISDISAEIAKDMVLKITGIKVNVSDTKKIVEKFATETGEK